MNVNLANVYDYLPDYDKSFLVLHTQGCSVFWEYEFLCSGLLSSQRQAQEIMLDYWRNAPINYWVKVTEHMPTLIMFEEHVITYSTCYKDVTDLKRVTEFFMKSPQSFLFWKESKLYRTTLLSTLIEANSEFGGFVALMI